VRDRRRNLRPKRSNRRRKVKAWLSPSEERAVSAFWDLSGEMEPFPRNLERYVALALPLTIIKLPRLRITDIQNWLAGRGAALELTCRARQLCGCLVAHWGEGLIFVYGADPQAEIRFTIAHELAHFLFDYLLPRSLALSTFGISVREVLDGLRRPSVSERLQAVFASRPLPLHINPDGTDQRGRQQSGRPRARGSGRSGRARALSATPGRVVGFSSFSTVLR